MKNIHVLPTDKPSRLYIHKGKLYDHQKTMHMPDGKQIPQNIYITSDVEIKEDDWGLSKLNEVILFGRSYNEKFYKKIILTTDSDLIKDGVEAIDDEFLEWFVKNPSCENVEVKKEMYMPQSNGKISDGKITHELSLNSSHNTLPFYKIIIPKEELECEHPYHLREYYNENAFKCFECNKITVDNNNIKESKQDSLEYGLLQHIKLCLECNNESHAIRLLEKYGFEKQDGLYDEKNMLEFGKFCHNNAHSTNRVKTFKELLEQFKDK